VAVATTPTCVASRRAIRSAATTAAAESPGAARSAGLTEGCSSSSSSSSKPSAAAIRSVRSAITSAAGRAFPSIGANRAGFLDAAAAAAGN
jgi:hypothetical protein